MIRLKTADEIEGIARAGRIVGDTLAHVAERARPGVSTAELDREAEAFIRSHDGAVPAFKGLYDFPGTLCTSVNEEIVHGIPSARRELAEGDVLKLDVGVKLDGLFADAALSVPIGPTAPDTERLLETTHRGLAAGIEAARVGATIGDVGAAIQRIVEAEGFSIVRELVGHGLGHLPHEDPQVPNYGRPGSGPRIQEGLVIAIEPMVNLGSREVRTLDDGWTVVTADGSLSAHFEHTVAVTSEGPRILTGARPRVTIQE
ncbi:MAG TPA: type I methionyl aminopeptidase [Gemmatimonadota bacterium]|nr:type I methionyl aminopeptidase [Gemmatimonadota bacterium]